MLWKVEQDASEVGVATSLEWPVRWILLEAARSPPGSREEPRSRAAFVFGEVDSIVRRLGAQGRVQGAQDLQRRLARVVHAWLHTRMDALSEEAPDEWWAAGSIRAALLEDARAVDGALSGPYRIEALADVLVFPFGNSSSDREHIEAWFGEVLGSGLGVLPTTHSSEEVRRFWTEVFFRSLVRLRAHDQALFEPWLEACAELLYVEQERLRALVEGRKPEGTGIPGPEERGDR